MTKITSVPVMEKCKNNCISWYKVLYTYVLYYVYFSTTFAMCVKEKVVLKKPQKGYSLEKKTSLWNL